MSGRLAVDFGTSNTVVAVWDAARGEGIPFHVGDYGRKRAFQVAGVEGEETSQVPSVIHYSEDRRVWIGAQVLDRGLERSGRTFRWMKRYIANRSPFKLRIDGRDRSQEEAGRDFLSAILASAAGEPGTA